MTRRSNSVEAPAGRPPSSEPGAAIAAAFGKAAGEGRAALMPYMMAGYPSQEASLAVAAA